MNHDENRHENVPSNRPGSPDLADLPPVIDADEHDVPIADDHEVIAMQSADTIERALRGELSESEMRRFEQALVADPDLKEAFENARFVRGLFERVETPRCPEELDASILAQIDLGERAQPVFQPDSRPDSRPNSRRDSRRESRRDSRQISPALRLRSMSPWWATAVAAALVIAALFLPNLVHSPGESPETNVPGQVQYTDAEIRAAAAQMELALALVSQTMSQTSELLQSEMQTEVRDRVTGSIESGIERGLRAIPILRTTPREDDHSRIPSPPRGDC